MKKLKPADGLTTEEVREIAMKIFIDNDVDVVFLEDGTIMGGDSGRDSLNEMLQYYLEREQYEYCAILRDRLETYNRLWPM